MQYKCTTSHRQPAEVIHTMNPTTDSFHPAAVGVVVDQQRGTLLVCRLVLSAFIGFPWPMNAAGIVSDVPVMAPRTGLMGETGLGL